MIHRSRAMFEVMREKEEREGNRDGSGFRTCKWEGTDHFKKKLKEGPVRPNFRKLTWVLQKECGREKNKGEKGKNQPYWWSEKVRKCMDECVGLRRRKGGNKAELGKVDEELRGK